MQPVTQASTAAVPSPARVEFRGSGGEYFRIWIVNVLLTLLTLGIYSAWAKVRREKYFHRNTRLADSAFDYDAPPMAILRGRVLAVSVLVAIQLGSIWSPTVAGAGGLLFAVALPWLVIASLRFRLHHTLHRGLRFGFLGRVGEAARVFLLWPVAGALSFGLLMPVAIQRQRRFLFGGAAFGGTRFSSEIPVGRVYRIYAGTLGLLLIAGLFAAGSAWLGGAFGAEQLQAPRAATLVLPAAIFLFALLAAGAWFQVRLANLAWNTLGLGPQRFRSDQSVPAFLMLQIGNLVGIVLTLGLFRPWAAIRVARYRTEHTTLVPGESLDAFVAGAQQSQTAAGDELAEIFGFDLGF